jgi:hypothetical protein
VVPKRPNFKQPSNINRPTIARRSFNPKPIGLGAFILAQALGGAGF